jgi:hypothetical protein
MMQQRPALDIRPRDGSQPENASGSRISAGRRRTVDVDDNNTYHPVLFRVSDLLHRKFKLAVVLSDYSNQQEFIIKQIEPMIDELLDKHGIEMV